MFNIISRLRPIHIDAFTYIEEVGELYAPDKSSKFLPQWWKNLETSYVADPEFPQVKSATVKRCVGILEYFKHGFMIPLWSDFALNMTADGDLRSYRYKFADRRSNASTHNVTQYTGLTDPNKLQHLKLEAPWRLQEKSGVMFNITQPTWNIPENMTDYVTLPGMSDFKYQDSINIQLLVPYPETGTKNILIKAGTPMYHVVPLSERKVKIKTHLVSVAEFNAMGNSPIKFHGSYKQRKEKIDGASKCPFKGFFNGI